MKISNSGIIGVSMLALMISGCQSARLSPLAPAPAPVQPEPLQPAPTDPVEKTELPPPSDPVTNDPTQFPDAPETGEETTDGAGGTDIAAVGNGGAITREQMIGSWSVSAGGQNCQMFITLTKGPSGYRAGTRGCPGEAADVKAWDVSNQQVVFTGSDGNVVARVYNTGNESYDGQTTGGQRISLRR